MISKRLNKIESKLEASAPRYTQKEIAGAVAIAKQFMDPDNSTPVVIPDSAGSRPASVFNLALDIDIGNTQDAPANYQYFAVTTKDPACKVFHNPFYKFPANTSQIYVGQNRLQPNDLGNYGSQYMSSNNTLLSPVYGSYSSASVGAANTNATYTTPMYYLGKFWYNMPSASSSISIGILPVTTAITWWSVTSINDGGSVSTSVVTAGSGADLVINNRSPGSFHSIVPFQTSLTDLAGRTLQIKTTVKADVNGEPFGVHIASPEVINTTDIVSYFGIADSMWFQFTGSALTGNGNLCNGQKIAGTKIWEDNNYDLIEPMSNGSGNMYAVKGSFAYIKPSQVTDFVYKPAYVNSTQCFDGNMLQDSLITLLKIPEASGRSGVMKLRYQIQFLSYSRKYPSNKSPYPQRSLELAIEIVRGNDQYFENDLHLKDIWNGIKKAVTTVAHVVRDYGPAAIKMAGLLI